jgi:hypothetical protein
MRIRESQLRAAVRREIKALLEADQEEEDPNTTPQEAPVEEPQPEEKPQPEKEEGPSKATQFAQKITERLKREPELSSPEAMVDIMTEFLDSLGFGSESKLQILKTVKTNTVR